MGAEEGEMRSWGELEGIMTKTSPVIPQGFPCPLTTERRKESGSIDLWPPYPHTLISSIVKTVIPASEAASFSSSVTVPAMVMMVLREGQLVECLMSVSSLDCSHTTTGIQAGESGITHRG